MSEFQSKIVTVIGLGESGFSAAKLLKNLRATVRVTDNHIDDLIKKRCHKLKKLGIKDIELGRHTKGIISNSSFLVVSPAVNKENRLIKEAHKKNIPIISEIELGFLNCRAPIIAITGTNGKTTTCSLIYEIFKKAKKNPILCGNIGRPFCDVSKDAKPSNVIILEVSSFQLTYINKFKPRVSIILNAECDHLDYHKDIEEYFEAKSKIYQNQTEGDFCILREKDYKKIFSNYKLKPKLKLISTEKKADLFVDNKGYIIRNINEKQTKIIHLSKLNLGGAKSLENILFIIALSDIYKISKRLLIENINNFRGLEHRLEIIGVFDGIKYVNDSKATNIAATRLALESIKEPVILIAGGRYKDIDISEIKLDFLKTTKEIILFGESKERLADVFREMRPVSKVKNLHQAVKLSKIKAASGDCVLLSPMCASFDMFDSYEQRGKVFKKEVKALNKQYE